MTRPDASPLYAVVDRRADGRPRVLAQYVDPEDARLHADVLRRVGDPAEVVLVSAIRVPEGARDELA